jgi:hypothetical protein
MHRGTCCTLAALVMTALAACAGPVAGAQVKLDVTVPADGGADVPARAKIKLPADLANVPPEKIGVTLTCASTGQSACGQIVAGDAGAELWWVLPEAKRGTSRWTASLSARPYAGKDVFAFEDRPGKHLDLRFAGRLVTRYMYEFDRSSKAKIFETYKPYHHVFDAAGKGVITKDAHGHDPHHRGIHIGWGRTTCGSKRYDFWSMSGGSAQVHRKFLAMAAGPVLARSTDQVDWIDRDGKTIVSEQRQVTCFRQGPSAIVLMEFAAKLEAVAGAVTLDANPEHGGFQYRPHNDVAVNVGATGGKQTADAAAVDLKTRYEFHKDGIKTPAQRLNGNRDLPWAAQSYALRGKRYSVQHLNHPSNPKGTVYSAYRQYGRFGAFFRKKLAAGEVLSLRYRVYATERKMPPREEMNLRHAAFATPPAVNVLK